MEPTLHHDIKFTNIMEPILESPLNDQIIFPPISRYNLT